MSALSRTLRRRGSALTRRRRDSRKHLLLVVENAAVPHDRRVWNQARAGARNGYVTIFQAVKKLGKIYDPEAN